MTREDVTESDWRVGIDVIAVDEVAGTIARFGDRYLRRVYTPRELEACETNLGPKAGRLAALFAAKEATIKVLQPVEARPDFRSIEVTRLPSGTYAVGLSGEAARQSDDAGIGELSVSVTQTLGIAAAVVVATCLRPEFGTAAPFSEEVVEWTR